MSTLRQDPLTGRWVIMAQGRQERPNEFRLMQRELAPGAHCPFCPGQESHTTPEILAMGREPDAPANGPGWNLRVFPNKFPAFDRDTGGNGESVDGLLTTRPGVGSHEVIVYSPDHADSLATLSGKGLLELLKVLRGRVEVISGRPDHRYVSTFCNHGPEAGATLAHPHMQIIGTPELPSLVVDKALRFSEHRQTTGGCLLCDLLKTEQSSGDRVIRSNDEWTALSPWASRFPWEILLVPSAHAASLTEAGDDNLAALAEVLSFSMRSLAGIHGDPSLNLVIHNAPLPVNDEVGFGDSRLDELKYNPGKNFHWHLEILPRLSRPAGFEVGTGFTINSVIPETAARKLREEGP
jgi:UDPglucose--hexose-1-phosphate uridylyltransferase